MSYKLIDTLYETESKAFQTPQSLIIQLGETVGCSPEAVCASPDDTLFTLFEITYSREDSDIAIDVSLASLCTATASSHAELELHARLEARLASKRPSDV